MTCPEANVCWTWRQPSEAFITRVIYYTDTHTHTEKPMTCLEPMCVELGSDHLKRFARLHIERERKLEYEKGKKKLLRFTYMHTCMCARKACHRDVYTHTDTYRKIRIRKRSSGRDVHTCIRVCTYKHTHTYSHTCVYSPMCSMRIVLLAESHT
jgi:hypothetical protein